MISGNFFVVLWIFIGIILLVFAYSLYSLPGRKNRSPVDVPLAGTSGAQGVCPVCQSALTNGAKLKTVLYPGKKDRICHIFGCPHCHPYAEPGITRICPVCKKKVPEEEYLVARLFERDGGKKHVHIIGCTNCRLANKSDRYHG